jgi:peptidoglycan/xylan/chitin deacetylase (PgdA/CDA1 family)
VDKKPAFSQNVAVPELREIARRAAVQLLGSPAFSALRMRRIRRANPLIILCLHRVGPPDGSAFPPLAPELFDELLQITTRYFSVISFAQIDEPQPKPRLILTFDDGYRDFIDYAMPLLDKHGVRANLNVIPACVESGLPPIQVLAADFLGQAPEELAARIEIPGFDMRDARRRWPRLDALLRDRPWAERKRIADMLIPQMMAWQEFRPTPMLSRAQIAEAASPHEIGGHSFHHASMAFETDAYLQEDVKRCKEWIWNATAQIMRIYAFPNGSNRPGQSEKVRDLGVEHVLLAGGGFGGAAGIHDRIGVTARSRNEIRFRALAAHEPLRRRSSRA